MSTSAVIGEAMVGTAVLGSKDTTDDQIGTSERKPVDLFVPNTPAEYPKTLYPFPKNYTIYLPSDKYNPIEKIAAQVMGKR